jgi:hypothetical protein
VVRIEIIQEKKDRIATLIEEIKNWPDEAKMHLIEELLNSSKKDVFK